MGASWPYLSTVFRGLKGEAPSTSMRQLHVSIISLNFEKQLLSSGCVTEREKPGCKTILIREAPCLPPLPLGHNRLPGGVPGRQRGARGQTGAESLLVLRELAHSSHIALVLKIETPASNTFSMMCIATQL